MTCERWREAVSALADGEDPGLDPALVEAHIARCGACRAYRQDVDRMRRRSAVREAPRLPDLSTRVVKLDRIADRTSRWGVVRGVLVVVAVEIIALSLPGLVLGEEQAASPHTARHLGAFSLAYGAALLVVAARPARARTVLPVATTLAAALAITAVVDVVDGEIPLVGEAIHVPELISVLLVWLLAVPGPRPSAGRAGAGPPAPAIHLVRDEPGDARAGRDSR